MPRTDALGGGSSVSSLRTYRYVRVSLVASVLLLTVGIGQHLAAVGPLRSISAAYYTPSRSIFVGALLAVGVALVVLAGRSVRRFLLLLAGMTAPLIALVPAPLPSDELERLTGTGCTGGAARCLPAGAIEDIAASLPSYLVVATAVLLVSLLFLALDRVLDTWAVSRIGVSALLLALLAGWSTQPSFAQLGHYAAAAVFFLLIAAAAGSHALAVRSEGVSGPGTARLYATCYAVLAVLIVLVELVLGVLAAAGVGRRLLGEHWLLIGEAAALALFAAFWILQTVENWNERDASLR